MYYNSIMLKTISNIIKKILMELTEKRGTRKSCKESHKDPSRLKFFIFPMVNFLF